MWKESQHTERSDGRDGIQGYAREEEDKGLKAGADSMQGGRAPSRTPPTPPQDLSFWGSSVPPTWVPRPHWVQPRLLLPSLHAQVLSLLWHVPLLGGTTMRRISPPISSPLGSPCSLLLLAPSQRQQDPNRAVTGIAASELPVTQTDLL